MKSPVAIVECRDYLPTDVLAAVRGAIDLIGGINNFIKPGSAVLLKPNLLMAIDPSSAVVTNPEVVRAVVKILQEIDCRIYLGDGPSVWGKKSDNIAKVYEKTGMTSLAKEEKIELVTFDKKHWWGKFPLTSWLDNCDYLISLPKFKTHDLTTLTGAIKNTFGLVPGRYKLELHKRYSSVEKFSEILVDIYQAARPSLNILDAIVAMEGDGPGTGGKTKRTGFIIVSPDGLAIDSILSLVMGLKPETILTNKEAYRRGLGKMDLRDMEIKGKQVPALLKEPFELPTTSLVGKIPPPLLNLAKKLIRFYPQFERDKCVLCLNCLNVCPAKVISLENHCLKINYKNCLSCFCCQETCAHAAIRTHRSILMRLLNL